MIRQGTELGCPLVLCIIYYNNTKDLESELPKILKAKPAR